MKRERERIPEQIKEALDAGKRAAAKAEEDLDREVRSAFEQPLNRARERRRGSWVHSAVG